MVKGYRIEKFESVEIFKERMKNFNENIIECTSHTFFRASAARTLCALAHR